VADAEAKRAANSPNSVGSTNSEGYNGIDGLVPRMQDTYEMQASCDVPGIFEFLLGPFTMQLLAKYGLITMIFVFLDLCISTMKCRY
jgi:hypothetical protein